METVTPGSDLVSHEPAATGDEHPTKRGLTLSSPHFLPPASRRREWLARGLYEAALILVGLLGAFALNQWQDARQRAARADAMIVAIRAELASNLELQEPASTYNTRIVGVLKQLRDSGQTFLPADQYRGGLFKRPKLTAAAWTSAQNGGILEELPVDTIVVLGRVYEAQRDYQDSTGALFEALYAAALTSTDYRSDGIEGVAQLAGVLSDFAGRGAGLVRDYRSALEYLDSGQPARGTTPSNAAPAEPGTAGEQRP